MFVTNHAEGRNSYDLISKNGRNNIDIDDLDLEGVGGGGTKTPEQIAAEEEAAKRKAEEDAATTKDKETLDLISEVENDFVKNLKVEDITTVLEKHNAVGFDKEGNLVDVDGKVVKKVDEYKDDFSDDNTDPFEDVEVVEIEGVEYSLNENKDAVDKDGNVIKTKDEILEMLKGDDDDSDDETSYVSSLSSLTGFKALDENGEELEFEDTIEGLAAREKYIVEQEGSRLAQEQLTDFFSKNPDIKEMYDYKKLHGSLQDFAVREKYDDIVIEDSNDDQHKSIIIKAELARGNSEERAKNIADFFISDGKGKAEAEASLEYLKEKQLADDKAVQDSIKQKQEAEFQAIAKNSEEAAKIISSGKVKGYTIPETFNVKLNDGTVRKIDKRGLFQFVTEPIDGNLTRYDLMKDSVSMEEKIFDAYLKLTGYSYDALIKEAASQQRLNSLKTSKNKASTKVVLKRQPTGPISASDIV